MAKREIKYFLDFHGLDRYDDIVKEKITKAIAEVVQFNIVVVESLPEIGEEHTIYLVPAKDSSIGNIHEEYLWINNKWELIGSTQINLSDYYTKEEINSSLNEINDNINDVSLRIDNVSSRIPTLTSQLVNDSSFVNELLLIDVEYTTANHIINLHKNVSILFETKLDIISDLNTIRNNASSALQPEDLSSWVKQPNKPTYTALEVGALPNSTIIPNKTSLLTNDSSFVTEDELASLDLSAYVKNASLEEVEYVTSLHITSLHDDVSALIENISTLKNDVSTLQEYIINLEQRIVELENGN